MTKTKETKKQRFQPWSGQELKDLTHTLLQIEVQKREKDEEALKYKMGLEGIDEEIEFNILQAKMELKAAQIRLAAFENNKINQGMQKDMLFKKQEAQIESERLQQNLSALQKQIDEGKPILQDYAAKKPKE